MAGQRANVHTHLVLKVNGGAREERKGGLVDDDTRAILLEHHILLLHARVLLQLEFVREARAPPGLDREAQDAV